MFKLFNKKRKFPDFSVSQAQMLKDLPLLSSRHTIDIHYPVLLPYTSVHIIWDSHISELLYTVQEPQLSDSESELFKKVKAYITQYADPALGTQLIQYLHEMLSNYCSRYVKTISNDLFLNIMYYLYRDIIGYGPIDALMHDTYIEDIECNGADYPLYIVHRIYENMRTNITLNVDELRNLVERLALRSNRYVSYATPLLDGTLPDGSRVNATYSSDITTRGPTFTIRRFNSDPLTPSHLILNNTLDAVGFAYLWLAIEYHCNIIIIGETSSGKTTLLNAIMHFVPEQARICSIEDTREINLAHSNWLPAVSREGVTFASVDHPFAKVSLFDLLKETFRQNPDYVVIGEARGEEVYVMFQGMASGHPTYATFHASNVESLIRRLMNKPINLMPELINSLDIVISVEHVKNATENRRRVGSIMEVYDTDRAGKVKTEPYLYYDVRTESFLVNSSSDSLNIISKKSGMSLQDINKEIRKRARYLKFLAEKHVTDYRKFNAMINRYYTR